MKVFVAGATGAIGRPLVEELHKRGHEVIGLSRSDANDRTIRERGGTPVRADLFDEASLARAMTGCDAVVRVATHIPLNGRSRGAWKENDRIRREGTRALLAAAKRAGVPRYVQESIAWATPDEEVTRSALDAEKLAGEAPLRTATLRLGLLYGRDTVHHRQFAEMLRKRRLPVIGDGRSPMSFLHVADAAAAFAAAVEKEVAGAFDVVDDEPTPVGDFFDAYAESLGAPRPMRVPRWVGALGAGSYVARFLTTPLVRDHAAFTKAAGWRPKYPTYREGFAELRG